MEVPFVRVSVLKVMLTRRQESVWRYVLFMLILTDFLTRQALKEFVLVYAPQGFTLIPTQESVIQLVFLPFTQTTGLIDVWITALIHSPTTATEFAWTFVTLAATQALIIPLTNVCLDVPQCPITTTKTEYASFIVKHQGTLPILQHDSV